MTPRLHHATAGASAGLVAALLPLVSGVAPVLAVGLGLAAGAGVALIVDRARTGAGERAATGASLGLGLWALVHVIAPALASGALAPWTATAVAARIPALAGWMLWGAAVGLLLPLARALVAKLAGPEALPDAAPACTPVRIVILGGGFAGVATATHLERRFGGDPAVELVLVSDSNALLFTPMLAEVAGGSLEAPHISTPLRTSLRRTDVVRGAATAVAVETRTLTVATGDGGVLTLRYDHLVLALGAVSNFLGLTGVERESLDFKTLADAVRIRDHVIDRFERADDESDAQRRRALTTMVVAGGGFAGVELAGALNDFARGMLAWYPGIARDEVRVVLVHSRDRILPELSEQLGAYARERMAARGVEFRLGVRLTDARPGVVVLGDGSELAAATLVWTAGTAPNPLLRTLPVERDKRGAVLVDATLAIPGHAGLWAVGDCAAVPDLLNPGATCPPTAQFAIREAARLAANLHAVVEGRSTRPFRFKPLGVLCVVGHHTACAEIRGRRFSGLFAWFLWRGIYLSKLPGFERKLRVAIDWAVELFFPRDLVSTTVVPAPVEPPMLTAAAPAPAAPATATARS